MVPGRTESSNGDGQPRKTWHGAASRARILAGVPAIGNRSQWGVLLVGSAGVGFLFATLGVLVWQVFHAMEHRVWAPLTTRHVVNDALIRQLIPPAIRTWMERPPASGNVVHSAMAWFLDEVPLVVILGGIAVVLLLSARRYERSGAGR